MSHVTIPSGMASSHLSILSSLVISRLKIKTFHMAWNVNFSCKSAIGLQIFDQDCIGNTSRNKIYLQRMSNAPHSAS